MTDAITTASYTLHEGDCRDVLPTIPAASIDAVICDPPYPCIRRSYGTLTEAQWHDLMHAVVRECRRVLRPHGSAVFVLQPNSRKVGSMRAWLWQFMAWCCEEWNMVQDAWWWNINTAPTVHCQRTRGLMRPSLKACVWVGNPDCYRDQTSVLMDPSPNTISHNRLSDDRLDRSPSGHHGRFKTRLGVFRERGGVVPFNVQAVGNHAGGDLAGNHGHGAGTPLALTDWWIRYLTRPGSIVLDPFCGSGTTGVAALKRNRSFIGIEQVPEYVAISRKRLDAVQAATPLLTG